MNEGDDPFASQEPPMPRYKVYDYDQDKLIPIRFSKQIVPGTFEYTLNYLIDHVIDVSVFAARFASAWRHSLLLDTERSRTMFSNGMKSPIFLPDSIDDALLLHFPS